MSLKTSSRYSRLRDEGKTRYLGFTAKGTDDLHALVKHNAWTARRFSTTCWCPVRAKALPDYPVEDYRQLLSAARSHGVGSIGVRVLPAARLLSYKPTSTGYAGGSAHRQSHNLRRGSSERVGSRR